jgi:hypothetical protein
MPPGSHNLANSQSFHQSANRSRSPHQRNASWKRRPAAIRTGRRGHRPGNASSSSAHTRRTASLPRTWPPAALSHPGTGTSTRTIHLPGQHTRFRLRQTGQNGGDARVMDVEAGSLIVIAAQVGSPTRAAGSRVGSAGGGTQIIRFCCHTRTACPDRDVGVVACGRWRVHCHIGPRAGLAFLVLQPRSGGPGNCTPGPPTSGPVI